MRPRTVTLRFVPGHNRRRRDRNDGVSVPLLEEQKSRGEQTNLTPRRSLSPYPSISRARSLSHRGSHGSRRDAQVRKRGPRCILETAKSRLVCQGEDRREAELTIDRLVRTLSSDDVKSLGERTWGQEDKRDVRKACCTYESESESVSGGKRQGRRHAGDERRGGREGKWGKRAL